MKERVVLSWWARLKELHDSYINLENGEKPSFVVMDTGSYRFYSEERKNNEPFFFGKIIVVPRCGCSEVKFYHSLMETV